MATDPSDQTAQLSCRGRHTQALNDPPAGSGGALGGNGGASSGGGAATAGRGGTSGAGGQGGGILPDPGTEGDGDFNVGPGFTTQPHPNVARSAQAERRTACPSPRSNLQRRYFASARCAQLLRAIPEHTQLAGTQGESARALSAVYKQVLLKMVSPQALLGLSQRLFKNYFDTGLMQIKESRRGYVHATWIGCEGWDENLWAELAGSCEVLLEMAGAKHVRLRVIKGGRTSDDACEMEAHWA